MGRLEDRVAFVTGAASGIGAACALRFAREGARIAGIDLAKPESGVWNDAAKAASDHWFAEVDVRDEAAIESAVDAVVARFGRIDIAVNAAGVAGGGPVHQLDTAEWDRVLDINLKGTFLCCKYELRPMIEQGSGSIINLASVEGIEGFEGGSAYNASKGGVVILTKNLAIDYARKGIRVNCICPGFIETPMTAILFDEALEVYRERITDAHHLGRFGTPDEIAGAAYFLASDDASFVTGHSLVVDGGFTCGHRIGLPEIDS